ncbi:MAG: toll/interleukin-1 receptor domain-containing protein [Clostridiales bacterium]|nr:toll/interleukin-1 receptor domain-containing protein [Clostridiales bacterium]
MVAAALTQRGHDVWFDKDKLHEGQNWRKEIAEGLEKSNGVVACISDHYVRPRSVCLDELNIAIGVTRGEHVLTVLLGDESIVPASLCYNQWLDMHDWEDRMKGDPAAFEQWFQANMRKLFAALETEDNRTFSGAIQTLQEKLQVSPNTSRQSSLLKKPFVGRQWLTNQVVAWLDDPKGERLCFLSGDPGVGKSAFAANFTHYNPRVAAALFCWAGENRFNDPRAVLKMLAFLLACRIPDYRRRLLARLDGEDRLGEYNERELFRVLLEEPMHGLIDGERETLCIVIDGLDEAGTAEENLLAETLGRYMPLLPPWLRVLVTGRPVAAVTQSLGSGRQMPLDGRSQENLADVRQYFEETLRDRCAETPNWQASLDELTRRSHGIFLYAELVCQGILAGKLALTDWDKFPDGLQDAFTRWFQWFFPDKRAFEAQFALPLGALCAVAEPLPLEELRRVFGWNESQLHRFLRRIDVLLNHGESVFGKETVTLSHKYIGEWLTDPHLNSLYFVSVNDAKEAMAGAFYDRFQKDPKELTEFESLHLCELLLDCGKAAEWFEAVFSGNLCWNIINAGDYCQEWGHLDEAMKCYRCALSVTEQGKRIFESLEMLRNYSACAERIGELERTAGNRGAALDWYKKSLDIRERLAETCDTPLYQMDLNVSYEKLGNLAREDGDWLTAREWYEKGLDITEQLAKSRGIPEDWRDLSVSYENMGNLAQEEGERQAARNW